MARKGNNPETKRRYQSPQTPPQAPRSSPGTQQGRGQADFDTEDAEGAEVGIGADFDLQKASRDELDAIARELDIEDFETMNREELVMEIRERS